MKLTPEWRLVLLALIAFAIGSLVLILNPDYRIARNIESNWNYYPEIASHDDSSSEMLEEIPQPVDF